MITSKKLETYGLNDVSVSIENMEKLDLQFKLDSVITNLNKITTSLESDLAVYQHNDYGNNTIDGEFTRETPEDVSKSFYDKVKAVIKRIGEFFSRIFSVIIDYVSNLSIFKKRMLERDKKNLETLKKFSTNNYDFKKEIHIPINGKLLFMGALVNEPESVNVRFLNALNSDIDKFYHDLVNANLTVIAKTEQCLKVNKKVMGGSPVGNVATLRDGIKAALRIDNINISRLLRINYKEKSNNFESVYEIIEPERKIPNNSILSINSEKEVIESIKDMVKMSTNVIHSESSIVGYMDNISSQLKELKKGMDFYKSGEMGANNDRIMRSVGLDPKQKHIYIEMFSALRHMLQNCVDLLKPILSADKFISGSYSSFLNSYIKAIAQ